MGLPRRFLDLIVQNNEAAARSLHRVDLKRLGLFYPTPPPPPPPAPIRWPTTTTETESILLPSPILNFKAHSLTIGGGEHRNLACYPFGQRKVLSTDQAGRNLLYDVDTRDVAAMPEFHRAKLRGCLSLFVPASGGGGDREDGGGGSLYLMARELRQARRFRAEVGQPSVDFEVLFYDGGNGRTTSHCRRLPLPPFVLDDEPVIGPDENNNPEIRSYAVVGGGSHVCVSVDGRGTYALDTASHTWSKVGDWTLPFHGKVEYVPELKLWFGLSAGDDAQARHLAAADLSAIMDDAHSPPPQLAAGGHDDDGWEEFRPPAEWAEQELGRVYQMDVQLVSLGSGRFCVARFFVNFLHGFDAVLYFAVLTGVEVVPRVLATGDVKLEMIPHKSMCHHMSHVDGTYIEQLF